MRNGWRSPTAETCICTYCVPLPWISPPLGTDCLAARKRPREITRLYEEKLRPHGLRATQFSILAALAQTGPSQLGELVDLLGLERTSLTWSANRLQDEEWVAEVESEDAPLRTLHLTHIGREKVESAYPAWKEAQDEVDEQQKTE